MWIARDNDSNPDVNYKGGLYLFFTDDKPEYTELKVGVSKEKMWLVGNNNGYYIDTNQFPDITFENSPVEVVIETKDNGTKNYSNR